MKNSKLSFTELLSFIALIAASSSLLAQTSLQTDLLECAANADVIQRLACYDKLAASQDKQSTAVVSEALPVVQAMPRPPRPVVIEPSPAPTPEPSRVETFGRNESSNQAAVFTNAEGAEQLSDTVTEVKRVEPTKLQITLASGQVWRQTVGKRFIVREGDTIEISQSGWGKEYRLFVQGKKGFIQVARQQ